MRALRDFNLPKIVSDDNPVFLGLISDLFPSLDVPRKRELDFEKAVKHAACDLKLQPEGKLSHMVKGGVGRGAGGRALAPQYFAILVQ